MDQNALIDYFKIGYANFGGVWQNIIDEEDFQIILELTKNEDKVKFCFHAESWVRIVYKYAQAFHATPRQKFKLIDTLIPLYNARIASLINELEEKNIEEAEEYFDIQAQIFENKKDYLLTIWK